MKRRELLAMIGTMPAIGIAGATPASALGFKRAKKEDVSGPVDGILVEKSKRIMSLVSNKQVVKSYNVNLGFSPEGHKHFQGDGRTPEGTYHITHRNPYSKFHLSLGVSYPSRADREFAHRHGRSPGGDIYIHGTGRGAGKARGDWTWGCIAVSDKEIEEIFQLVRPGTPITIKA